MPDKKESPSVKYRRNNIKGYKLELNKNTDADLIEFLESQQNVNGTIKQILKEWLASQKQG